MLLDKISGAVPDADLTAHINNQQIRFTYDNSSIQELAEFSWLLLAYSDLLPKTLSLMPL